MKISEKVWELTFWFGVFLLLTLFSQKVQGIILVLVGNFFAKALFAEIVILVILALLFSLVNVFLRDILKSDVATEMARMNARKKLHLKLALWFLAVGVISSFIGFQFKGMPMPFGMFIELIGSIAILAVPSAVLFGFMFLYYFLRLRLIKHFTKNTNCILENVDVNNKSSETDTNNIANQEKIATLDSKSKIWLIISIPFVIISVYCDVALISCFATECTKHSGAGFGVLIVLGIASLTHIVSITALSAFIIYRKRLKQLLNS